MRYVPLAIVFLPVAVTAQTIETVSVQKERTMVQTGPTIVEAARPGWTFRTEVKGTNLTAIPAPRLTAPAGSGTAAVNLTSGGGAWSYANTFATQAEMDAAFRSGTYAITVPGATIALNLTGDAFPNVPQVTASAGTWSGGQLVVTPGEPLTLTTNVFTGYSQNAVGNILFSVSGPGFSQETEVSSLAEPGRNSVSLTLPANALRSPQLYRVDAEFNAIVELRRGPRTEVAVYTTRTSFNLSTSPIIGPGPVGSPLFTTQPVSQEVAGGSTVVFSAAATGAASYSWRKNGTPIPGATGTLLVFFGATAADVGTYSVVAQNAAGASLSSSASLVFSANPDVGRLGNLSILTDVSVANPEFTVGVVVGGDGTLGTKPLLVRAVGPSLAPLGVTGALPDPRLEMFAGSTVVASNDDWAGAPALAATFTQVGAFAFTGISSKDAAIFNAATPAQAYTIQVRGGGTTGQVIAELYDATPNDAFVATTPRLVNVSVRKQIPGGATLTAGFYVGGQTARTVLVRAIGPGLQAFGVGDFMPDPRLELFRGETRIAENDNWGGDAQLTSASARVAAFAITPPTSRDAMLLMTLAPGSYSAVVSGVGNVGGSALVEVYEMR